MWRAQNFLIFMSVIQFEETIQITKNIMIEVTFYNFIYDLVLGSLYG